MYNKTLCTLDLWPFSPFKSPSHISRKCPVPHYCSVLSFIFKLHTKWNLGASLLSIGVGKIQTSFLIDYFPYVIYECSLWYFLGWQSGSVVSSNFSMCSLVTTFCPHPAQGPRAIGLQPEHALGGIRWNAGLSHSLLCSMLSWAK